MISEIINLRRKPKYGQANSKHFNWMFPNYNNFELEKHLTPTFHLGNGIIIKQ